MPGGTLERRLAAILSADAVGYSRLMSQDEQATIRTLQKYRGVFTQRVADHGGRVVDMPGDNVLAEFPAALGAIEAARAIQRDLSGHNAELPEAQQMRFRIGIHLGDVTSDGERVYGDGVNIAARIEGLASPGGVSVSAAVHEQVKKHVDAAFEDGGRHAVKNIADPVHVYALREGASRAVAVTRFELSQRAKLAAALTLSALLVAALVARIWFAPAGAGSGSEASLAATPSLPSAAPEPPPFDRRHVAVLPLANLGGAENASFTDGVHDTLITQVSRIPGITVISRTSVVHWRDKRPTLREIATALGVGTVVEGSVQRAGDQLRIQVQLIDAASDAHLWAEIYDRPARDLFAVQSEIAQKIAAEIELRLGASEATALQQRPTADTAAYDHFVLGRAYVANEKWEAAAAEFERAVGRDPRFALAYAELALALSNLAFSGGQPEKWPAAIEATDRALAIAPDLPEGHLARGLVAYWRERDYPGAEREMRIAVNRLSNHAQAHWYLGLLVRRSYRWEEAAGFFARARELDPRALRLENMVGCLLALQRWEEAERVILRWEAATGERAELVRVHADLAKSGDLRAFERGLSEIIGAALPEQDEWTFEALWDARMSLGDAKGALVVVDRMAQFGSDTTWEYRRAASLRALGDREANRWLRLARDDAKRELTSTKDPVLRLGHLATLALSQAALGDLEAALASVQEADRTLPLERDATDGYQTWRDLAFVPALAGDVPATFGYVRRLLAQRAPLGAADVWWSPYSVSLRSDPAFRALLLEHGLDVSKPPYSAPLR